MVLEITLKFQHRLYIAEMEFAIMEKAVQLAQEIAENAPLALLSLRDQMRPGLADAVNDVTTIESREQKWLQGTNDHKEGVKAVGEKRPGNFTGT